MLKWRAVAQNNGTSWRLYGCLVFSSNVRELIVQFSQKSLTEAAFLQLLEETSSAAASTVKFFQLVESPIFVQFFSTRHFDNVRFTDTNLKLC